jgi:natural product precursor
MKKENDCKKKLNRKLKLNKETVRELKNSELKQAAGGATSVTFQYCTTSWCCCPQ